MQNSDYKNLDEVIIHNQQEMDSIPEDFKGRIRLQETTEKVYIKKHYNLIVYVEAQASVVAWGNSSVVARENSSVVAGGNVQVVDRTYDHRIEVSANARIVYMPHGLQEFINFFGIKVEDGVGTFYKAVRKTPEGLYRSDHDYSFFYEIGEEKEESNLDRDASEDCGRGIHISTLQFALNYGESWRNLAILECTSKLEDIVCPDNTEGKVRTSKVMVVREVPLEECGVYGKILAKKLKRGAN